MAAVVVAAGRWRPMVVTRQLLCIPLKRIGLQLTSGEDGVRRWWRSAVYPNGFDEYYEESQYARRVLFTPLRRLLWP